MGLPSFPMLIDVLIERPNEVLSVQRQVRRASAVDCNLLQDAPNAEPGL